jgi:hypothetical protein
MLSRSALTALGAGDSGLVKPPMVDSREMHTAEAL